MLQSHDFNCTIIVSTKKSRTMFISIETSSNYISNNARALREDIANKIYSLLINNLKFIIYRDFKQTINNEMIAIVAFSSK